MLLAQLIALCLAGSVVVIDSGIDQTNPAFTGRIQACVDFTGSPLGCADEYGHGTEIAGVVDPSLQLVILKVAGAGGTSDWDTMDAALKWTLAHRVEFDIRGVNISYGAKQWAQHIIGTELSMLRGSGVLIVAGAGNDGSLWYPAADPAVIPAMWLDSFATLNPLSGRSTYGYAAPSVDGSSRAAPYVLNCLLLDNCGVTTFTVGNQTYKEMNANPGDFNYDGTVDGADYVLLRKRAWTIGNYEEWRENFGSSLVPPIGIPEPDTMLLIGIVLYAAYMREVRQRI